MRTIQIQAYKFEELGKEAKDKAIEEYRSKSDYLYCNWWDEIVDLDYLLPSKIKKQMDEKHNIVRTLDGEKAVTKVFTWDDMFFDMEYRGYIKFDKLRVTSEGVDLFRQFLRIPKRLWERIDFDNFWSFDSDKECTTKLEFDEQVGSLTMKQIDTLNRAKEIFQGLMDMALKMLRDEYDWLLSDEYIADNLISGDFEYEENGERI
jgi:hypothetical protein